MTARPIFIIGTERSGTNLLRLILNNHSNIAVPHPPHIMKFFSPLERLYGDLNVDANYRLLIDDVCRMVELHPYPWEIRPDRERVFHESKRRSLLSVYVAIYNQYRDFPGKKRWACKSTFMLEHVAEILRDYPDARFIHMVRDGRDVAVSAKSSIFNHFHVFYSAKRWKREQAIGLSWSTRLSPEQIMLLRYEDLISDPRGATQRLCAFLGEPFEEAMLEYHRSGEAKKSGSLSISWANTSRPVIRNNTEKFRQHLSAGEILLFEAIAFPELQQLGYALTCPVEELRARHEVMMRPKLRYRLSDFALSLKAEVRHLIKDSNSMPRLGKGLYMRYIRIARRISAQHA